MKKLCVLIGANEGNSSVYQDAAIKLGQEMASRKIALVYGGGRLGLMGVLASTVLENGGEVIGVITEHLHEAEAYSGLTELHVVSSMQERKKNMIEIADGFLVLPGGLGTLEELFEIWNAAKLKLHNKPIGLLDINNYFDKLYVFVGAMVDAGFLRSEACELVTKNESIKCLLDLFEEKINSQQPSSVVSEMTLGGSLHSLRQ